MELSVPFAPSRRVAPLVGGRDAIALILLAALAIGGLMRPFDIGWLISGDALYPLDLLRTPFLEYRSPPPNRLFPDIGVHAIVRLFASDPLTQKIAAGSILLVLVSLAVSATKGRNALLVALAITCSAGFGALDSASHFSLPLLLVLFQATRRPGLRLLVLFVGVFSDAMLLLPLAILYLREERSPSLAEWLAMSAAFVLSQLYAELGVSSVHVVLLVPAWVAGFWLARRMGLIDIASIGAAAALILAAWLGIVPPRYGLPVAASIALLFFDTAWRMPDWRAIAWPAAVVALFFATFDVSRAKRLEADFDCLGATLAARGIDVVAADHWSAKPLAFADLAAGRTTQITQIGFDDGRYHPWMAAHSAYGPSTVWAVRNRDTCAVITTDSRYCGQATTAPVVSREPVCRIFDLYRYATPLPLVAEPRPDGKWAAIRRNVMVYVDKAAAGSLARRLFGPG